MKFSIIISSSPSSNLTNTAIEYSQSILELQHEISLVFFQGDGVYNALRSNNKEDEVWQNWLKLLQDKNIKLLSCSSANIKRGLILNKDSIIKISGLGDLIMAMQESDKVIKF